MSYKSVLEFKFKFCFLSHDHNDWVDAQKKARFLLYFCSIFAQPEGGTSASTVGSHLSTPPSPLRFSLSSSSSLRKAFLTRRQPGQTRKQLMSMQKKVKTNKCDNPTG